MTDSTLDLLMVTGCLLALSLGPVILTALSASNRQRADRVMPWIIAALVMIELVHDLGDNGRVLITLAFLAGWFGPTLIERGIARFREPTHTGTLVVALLGLCAHAVGDGTLLRQAHESPWVASAIVMHSIPVGVGAWWLVATPFGARRAALTLTLLCAATIAGFLAGNAIRAIFDGSGWAVFTAFVGGSMMHVAFGAWHVDHHATHPDHESSSVRG